jgi:hypothetical protein
MLKSFLSSDEYQQAWNANAAAGRRVAYLSAYNHNGAVRLSAIFQQTNIEGNEATTVGRHNLTSSGYQTEFDTRMAQGYLTRCIAGYAAGSTPEFAAIWRKP